MKKGMYIVLIVMCLLFCFTRCGKSAKHPTKAKIKEDVSNISAVVSDKENIWHVVSVEETLAQEQNKSYETNVKVKLKNDMYNPAYKTLKLRYTYYDKGGWVLTDYGDLSSVLDANPIKGYNESEACAYVTRAYNGTAELLEHKTDLNKKEDHFVFNVKTEGLFWYEIFPVELSYTANNSSGLWLGGVDQEPEVSERKREYKDVNKWFYYHYSGEFGTDEFYSEYVFYYFDKMEDSRTTFSDATKSAYKDKLALGIEASVIVVKIADDGRRVEKRDFSSLPKGSIYSDNYVCYKKDYDSAGYDFGKEIHAFNIDHLFVDLSQNSISGSRGYDNYSIKPVDKIDEIVDVPPEVSEWLAKNMTN